MNDSSISYNEVSKLLERYRQGYGGSVTREQLDLLDEVIYRIGKLQRLTANILELNSKLLQLPSVPKTTLENNVYTFTVGGETMRIKLNQADPKVPIRMERLSSAVSYNPLSEERATSEEELKLQIELEDNTELFYQNAHRIIRILKYLPNMRRFKSLSTTTVRNQLIQHPEKSGVTYYSFGYGSTGPVVKRDRRNDRKEHMDEGFIPNSNAFIHDLTNALLRAIAAAPTKLGNETG